MIDTFFFGPSGAQLYGVYNEPLSRKDNSHGIILCYPFGQEYIRVHRSYQQLARRLADAGFHVMRFDFFGAGDSFGESDEATLAQWLKDLELAVEELKDTADVKTVSLVGLRLGAAVAALSASGKKRYHNLVLWEPVISGAEYIAELEAMQRKWLKDQLDKPGRDKWAVKGMESIGFPVPTALQEELRRLNLLEVTPKLSGKGLILARDSYSGLKELLEERMQTEGVEAELMIQYAPAVWLREERFENTLVPRESLDTIVNWLIEQAE